MKIKLTLRYIMMVIISTLLIIASGFILLTNLENIMQNTDYFHPSTFAYNFNNEIGRNNENELIITDRGQTRLLEQDAWIQILDSEGYVIEAFNEPEYTADHYTPLEIVQMNRSSNYRQCDIYYTGRINEDISFLISFPSRSWQRFIFEFDNQLMIRIFQILLLLAVVIFLIMGFIFSQKIAQPVTQIIDGVEKLSDGKYKTEYKEKGLYKSVFVSFNQLANRLRISEMERRKTKEQREKWISNISHDLKTPLSTIKGYSELLSNPEYELSRDEIKRYSETIHEKSVYMENMIEELRLNERLMHNGIILSKEKDNFIFFIREIIIDILNHPDYSDRRIEFLPTDESMTYFFDKDLLKRCFENLIYNALIHNDNKTRVTISLEKKKDKILVEIKDNGRGMNKKELDQLFTRYFRGTNTSNYKGTGLGMSIAKEVIEAHSGEISIESERGKGTKIKIIL